MLRISLPVGDDLLEIHKFIWKGKDAVYWNGELVSSKKRFFTSHHVFRVPNALTGQDDVFRVRVGVGLNGTSYGVKRNDQVLLGTFRDKLTHDNREKMPRASAPALDLNTPPKRRAAPQPEPVGGWREEDLIV